MVLHWEEAVKMRRGKERRRHGGICRRGGGATRQRGMTSVSHHWKWTHATYNFSTDADCVFIMKCYDAACSAIADYAEVQFQLIGEVNK